MAEIVSISIPKDSKGELERLGKQLRVKGRSELVRAALKSLSNELEENNLLKGGVHAVLLLTHMHSESAEELMHESKDLIKTHIHQHIKGKCVEVLLLEGTAPKVRELFLKAQKNKHIIGAKLVVV